MKTFLNLLRKFDKIEIPIIQRDYAHGRKDERSSSVRNLLIEALTNAAIDKQTEKLCLDFIYGRVVDAENGKIFIPFDGQQRLTTLFLFYRYVAERNGDLENYKSDFAKFSYNTRSSAKNFCIALCNEHILNSEHRLVDIKDRLWFLPSWQYDPTIQGMITVLKAIDEKISKRKDHISLSDLEANIYFEALPMDELGLDDDSYVTMNARFLSLTPWERFKSSFQKWVKYKKIYNFTGYEKYKFKKFDDTWLDLFYRDDDVNYDKNMMDMVHFHLYVMRNLKEDDKLSRPDFVPFSEYQEILNERKGILVPLFRFWNYLCESKEKDKNHIESVFPIWERREYAEDKEQEKKEGKESGKKLAHIIDIKNTSYNKRLAYYALMLYFGKNEESKDPLMGVGDWMRIVQNILEHANLSANDEQKHKKKIRELRKQFFNGDIINGKMKGDIWSKEIEEESLKYRFLQENIDQADDLYRLEAHPWIHGRLETYRYRSPDGNKKIDLDKLKKRREWLDNTLKKNLVDKETIADFRYKIIKIILNSKRGDFTRTVIEFGYSDSSWVSELKKGTWDAVWDYYGGEIPDIPLSNNIENWPKGRLELLEAVLKERQGAYVKLAYYGNIPCVRTNEKSNVATSYLLDFEHYVIHKEKGKLLPNRYRAAKFVRNGNDFQLKLKFTDSNEEEFTPYNVKPEYIDAWKPLINEDKFKEDDENRPVL